MAGNPRRRARKLAAIAETAAQVHGIPIAQAAMEIEAKHGRIRPAKPAEQRGPTAVPGEAARLQLEAAREEIRKSQGEWLIGSMEDITAAYDDRDAQQAKFTPAMEDRIIALIRSGVPLKDSLFGPGAATACGVHASTVWHRVQTVPDFAKRFREARDASSEVLEDEMRAMLPAALGQPHLLDSLEFIAGRLEWLAKTRNRDRYDPKAKEQTASGITINILGRKPEGQQLGRDITAETVKLEPARQPVTIPKSLRAEMVPALDMSTDSQGKDSQ